MCYPIVSLIPFRTGRDGTSVDALGHARILHSSTGFGWQGLKVEVGENKGWAVDDLVIDGHYVALNLNPAPLVIEQWTFVGFRRVEIAPGTLWVQPAGDPFTFRVAQTSCYAGIVLDLDRVRALLGADLALEPAHGLADTALVSLVRAIVAETESGGHAGRLFADGVAAALAAQLGRLHGTEVAAIRGGIAPRRLRHVAEFIDSHLAESLPLDVLSGLAGLSPFHFARAFKQSTGTTPHRYVLDRRLERARDLLATGNLTVAETAYACGFADHAHLSRVFRQHFGVAPSAVAAARPGR